MRREECAISVGAERLAATKIYAASGQQPSVVAFHGYGVTASHAHILYLLEGLAAHGLSSASFDFSGNGGSTGKLEEVTLNLRRSEALAATKILARQDMLTIIGTSMGGYIAALLAPVLKPQSLILFCPAAYPEDAMDIKFGENFMTVARRPGAYVHSPAFQALDTFEGNLLIVAAGKDTVIPKEVISLYVESAPFARFKKLIWLDEAEHKVHPWLEQREEERANILREVLALAIGDR